MWSLSQNQSLLSFTITHYGSSVSKRSRIIQKNNFDTWLTNERYISFVLLSKAS